MTSEASGSVDESSQVTGHTSTEVVVDQENHRKEAGTTIKTVGGEIKTPAYCLLDGLFDDTHVQYPITSLPAILGREHAQPPKDFVSLGQAPAVSRQQCRIDYHPHPTGILSSEGDNKFTFRPQKIEKPVDKDGIPKKGHFYTITSLGKNPTFVDKHPLELGETLVLKNGAAIRMGNARYKLYFLLPQQESKATMKISLKRNEPAVVPATVTSSPSSSPPTKKPKKSATASAATPSSAPAGWPTLQAEIDSLSTDELLRQLSDAIENDLWERRHQLIGSTLSYRAVLEAAAAAEIREMAETGGGVARTDIMKWIAESDRFATWVQQMLSKLEDKSYQSSITKALIKANFVRTASSGRYIKWLLPEQAAKAASGGESKKDDSRGGNEQEEESEDDAEENDDGKE